MKSKDARMHTTYSISFIEIKLNYLFFVFIFFSFSSFKRTKKRKANGDGEEMLSIDTILRSDKFNTLWHAGKE